MLTADDIAVALGPVGAVAAVRDALRGGLDPDAGVPRQVVPLQHGQGLLMPSEFGDWFGVKIATVAPGNPARGLARINATYLLHDAETLCPVAILDGVALTTVRTPAVSVAACLDLLRRFPDPLRLVVFGIGPQGAGHVHTIRAHVPVAEVTAVTRGGGPVPAWADRHLAANDPALTDRLCAAAVIVTATSASEPVFAGRYVRDDAVVIAVGSHEPAVRELDGALLARGTVVVESRDTALREAGDVVLAVAEGQLAPGALVTMADVLADTGQVLGGHGPTVVKTTGMAWQDLVVAVAAYRCHCR